MRLGLLRTLVSVAIVAGALGAASPAHAFGGRYVFDGGTAQERAEVRAALDASRFDWGLVPSTVTIHVTGGVDSYALPGHIWLDRNLLRAGVFSWAVVQDEYAHQVDFALFDGATREELNTALGGKAWDPTMHPGLRHSEYGAERFASTLVWAFWPSRDNSYRPKSRRDESAAMAPARFRALVAGVVTQRLSHLALN